MACHGDQGQGLTEDFRALYPPEDRNCWESGCHGPRPYENGFTLPPSVPALFGAGRLSRFGDAGRLQAFVSAAMPWHDPGSLSQQEYWQVTAFLLRENGADPGSASLGPANAGDFVLPAARDASPTPAAGPASSRPGGRYPGAAVAVGLLLMIALWVRMERLRRKSGPKK
jgi:cytochrome c